VLTPVGVRANELACPRKVAQLVQRGDGFFVQLNAAKLPVERRARCARSAAYKDVPVVDSNCSKKVAVDPETHTRECALKCQMSGYGNDHHFLRFDSAGNAKIAEALKASDKKDHLRVDVTGEVKGDTIEVTRSSCCSSYYSLLECFEGAGRRP